MSMEDNYKKAQKILKDLLDTARGKNPLSGYLKPVLDPDNPQTSSNLTPSQVSFIEDAFWISTIYPEFQSMKTSAEEVLLTTLSKDGFGVKQSVNLVQAMTKSKETEKTSVIEKVKDKVTKQ